VVRACRDSSGHVERVENIAEWVRRAEEKMGGASCAGQLLPGPRRASDAYCVCTASLAFAYSGRTARLGLPHCHRGRPACPDGRGHQLARRGARRHLPAMFMVSEEDAAAIRTTFEHEGELAAAIELRRRFPGIADNARARECARTIAGWRPLSPLPAKGVRLRPEV
jgi:hypothetical protein